FDPLTGDWSIFRLPQARKSARVVAVGSQVLFADMGDDTPVGRVDAYDVQQDTWSSTQLTPKGDSVVIGDTVIFVGDQRTDVYDASTGEWRVAPARPTSRGRFAVA